MSCSSWSQPLVGAPLMRPPVPLGSPTLQTPGQTQAWVLVALSPSAGPLPVGVAALLPVGTAPRNTASALGAAAPCPGGQACSRAPGNCLVLEWGVRAGQ